jgi:hypothetical protein
MAAWIHRAADLIEDHGPVPYVSVDHHGGARSIPRALLREAPDVAVIPHTHGDGCTTHTLQVEETLAGLLGIEYGTAYGFSLPLALSRWCDAVADVAVIAARLHACAEKLAG